MKKIITLLLISALDFSVSGQTIPNAGFETWFNDNQSGSSFLVPQGWLTTDQLQNAFQPSYVGTSVIRSTSSRSGQYAALMQTSINSGDTMNGAIFSHPSLAGLINSVFGGNNGLGFPYTVRSANLQGYYKLTRVGGDSARVGVYMTKWNSSLNVRDTLVNKEYKISANQVSYTLFNIPLTYMANLYPDTAFVVIGIDGPGAAKSHVGTLFYVDDLAFSGTVPVGIKEFSADNKYVEIYPNPFTSAATIRIDDAIIFSNGALLIYDVLGNQVQALHNISGGSIRLEKGEMKTGVYFYKLLNDNNVITNGRFMVE